ncbi:MAG: sugar phosphate isomerase/epimerase [Vicinamibacterales bacterium]
MSGPRRLLAGVTQAARPNSLINGVQVGLIVPYSLGREAGDAESILSVVTGIGISAIELQTSPVEAFAGRPPTVSGRGGGRGGGRGQMTDEERAAQAAARREAADTVRAWRTSVSMDRFKALRAMYNDAGVSIYGFKFDSGLDLEMTDEEYEYVFHVAEALGASHVTMELPTDGALLRRIGRFAERRKIYAAYHTHTQGSMTAFDEAFAASPANMSNIDVGHYVAGTGESPLPFFEKFHDRIASFHMKDRRTPANGGANMPWGQGDTPLTDLLHLVQRNRWTMPATIELEYPVPGGSTRAAEISKCLEYCRQALAQGPSSERRPRPPRTGVSE